MTDAMKRSFDSLLIRSFDIIEDVSSLMGPTPLHRHMPIDQRERGKKPFASIYEDQLESLAFKPPPIQIIQEPFPGRLRLSWDLKKIDNLLLPIGFDPQSYQHGASLSAHPRPTPHDDAIQNDNLVLVRQSPLMIGLNRLIQLLGNVTDGGGADRFAQDRQQRRSDFARG